MPTIQRLPSDEPFSPARRRAPLWMIVFGAAVLAVVAWGWVSRQRLATQWACYRVGASETFEQAEASLGWFEQGDDPTPRLDALAEKWGSGNARFDLFLAQYLYHPHCGDALRARLAARIGREPRLLGHWAHYWSWRAAMPPAEQIDSVLRYHDALAVTEPPGNITWREVLDLPAVVSLWGRAPLAAAISPEGWLDAYRRLRRDLPARRPAPPRPEAPLPDWKGPLPPGVAPAARR